MNEIKEQVKKSAPLLIDATIRRRESGLEIEIKSPVDWSAFANKTKGTFKVGGVDCFVPKDMSVSLAEAGVRGVFSTTADFTYNDYPNLTLLLARDIQKGVVFNFGLVPIPESRMEQWKVNLRDQAKTIYLSYMKPVSKRIVITTQTIEAENHD